jgi:ribosomal protein S12 methylthiotransferase accessory factor
MLEELGIQTDEVWFNNLDCFYSCRVTIAGTAVGTNGKGVSRDLALASALAEFMERLQNQALLQPDLIGQNLLRSHGFYNDPLEKCFASDKLPAMPREFKRHPIPGSPLNLYDLWEKGKSVLAGQAQDLVYVPFYNLRKDKTVYLPQSLISLVYGSNGMCAGNSAREAIVQGLSEIMERYAAGRLYFGRLTPPTVPRAYIKSEAPEQYRLIQAMEDSGDFMVTVKDCSLGDGVPVVGAIVVYKPASQYLFVPGSDPSFAMALERCLTEFFQGMDIAREKMHFNPVNLHWDGEGREQDFNFWMLLRNGKGLHPASLFDDQPGYEFQPYAPANLSNPEQRLQFLLDWLEQRDYTLFARDVSYLGFNAYLLLVPGLSENYYPEKAMDLNRHIINRMEYLGALPQADEDALRDLLRDMEDLVAEQRQPRLLLLREYAGGKVLAPHIWSNSLHSVLSMLCFKLGEYDKAFRYYSEYVNLMEASFSKPELATQVDLPLFYATREYLRLWAVYPGKSDKVRHILRTAYDENITDQVMSFFALAESDFSGLWAYVMGDEMPACWDCASCSLSPDCRYSRLAGIVHSLKEKMLQNPIDQLELRSVFDLKAGI